MQPVDIANKFIEYISTYIIINYVGFEAPPNEDTKNSMKDDKTLDNELNTCEKVNQSFKNQP